MNLENKLSKGQRTACIFLALTGAVVLNFGIEYSMNKFYQLTDKNTIRNYQTLNNTNYSSINTNR